MISGTLKRAGRVGVWLALLASILGTLVPHLPWRPDSPILLIAEFFPRWLFAFGMLPALVLASSRLLRLGIGMAVLTSVGLGIDFRLAGCMVPQGRADLRVATYNVGGGFVSPQELMLWYRRAGLDALLLQEVPWAPAWPAAAGEAGLKLLCQLRLCVVTEHPISKGQLLDRETLEGWGAYAAQFTLCPWGACFPLVNLHLDTPRHALEALVDGKPLSQVRQLIRSRDLESSIASLVTADSNAIIAGDFNMTERGRLYRRDWQRWRNAFGVAGCGLGSTKESRFASARIDHILAGDRWDVLDAKVDRGYGGDHRPLIASLQRSRSG